MSVWHESCGSLSICIEFGNPDFLAGFSLPQTINIQRGAETDHIAKLVMARYRRAKEFRSSYKLDGNVGADEWQRRCYRMHNKRHEESELKAFPDMRFYLGVGRLKVDGTAAAINDLVSPIIDQPFNLNATPIPTLSKDGEETVNAMLKRRLMEVMEANQLAPADLVRDGEPDPRVKAWIKENTQKLRLTQIGIENELTAQGIKQETAILKDWYAQSNWKMEFTDFLRNGLRDLSAYIRGPEMMMKPINRWNGNTFETVYEPIMSFRCIPWDYAFPAPDSRTPDGGEGFTEINDISRNDLTLLMQDKRYNATNIKKILDERLVHSRDWLMEDFLARPNRVSTVWQGTETIKRVIHQGVFSGRELKKGGFTGIDDDDMLDMEVEVIANIVIRFSRIASPGGMRNVFGCSYRMESGPQGSSINSILFDSQLRINRQYRLVSKAVQQQAGASYFVNMDSLDGTDIDGVFQPFEVNPLNSRNLDVRAVLNSVQPQPTYSMLWQQLLAEIKMTDEISGVSILNYAAPQNGPGLRTATGMSLLFASAAKQLKNYMYAVDTYVLPGQLKIAHRMAVSTTPSLHWTADANIASAGLSSLLARELQEARITESLGLLSQAAGQGLLPRALVADAFNQFADSLGLRPDSYQTPRASSTEIAGALAASSPGTEVAIAPQTPVNPAMLDGGLTKGNNRAAVI